MTHLVSVGMARAPGERAAFPLSLPIVRALAERPLSLDAPITLLVGENGAGKSTLLEGIACAAQLATVGALAAERDPSLAAAQALAAELRLSWRRRTRRGLFLRAEDFFGYVRRMQQLRAELRAELADSDERLAGASEHARQLARGPYQSQLHAIDARHGGDLDARSHGESFMALFESRLVPGGLYLLDEPEAPLSPARQIVLLQLLLERAERDGAQFIIATHAPILMAAPGATIYLLEGGQIAPAAYEQLEHVRITRAFLASPRRFLGGGGEQ